MIRSLIYGLLGTSALVAGLMLSVPVIPTAADQHAAEEDGATDGAPAKTANSRDLPVLVAPLISTDSEVVGYQSLALSLVTTETYSPEELKEIQIAIEDAFNEFIATTETDDRRSQFNDLLTLGETLEGEAQKRLGRDLRFDLVALQSDIFKKTETRQNLIEPKTGSIDRRSER